MSQTAAPPPPAEPTLAEHRARQLAMLKRLAELNMDAAEAAAEQIRLRDNHPGLERPAIDPHLALARATRAVTHVIACENRILSGDATRATYRPTVADSRRPVLRETLHKLAEQEPDRSNRISLRRLIDDRLDEELAADPDHTCPIYEIFTAVTEEFGLRVDPARLPDAVLGMPPRPLPPPGIPEHAWPSLWERAEPETEPPNTT